MVIIIKTKGVAVWCIVVTDWSRLLINVIVALHWMRDFLLTGKPPQCVPNYLGQLSLLSLRSRLIEYQHHVWLWLGGAHSLVTGGR